MILPTTLGAVVAAIRGDEPRPKTLAEELDAIRATIAEKREYSRKLRSGEATERRLALERDSGRSEDSAAVRAQVAGHLSIADTLRAKRLEVEGEIDALRRQAVCIEEGIRIEKRRRDAVAMRGLVERMAPLARQLAALNQRLEALGLNLSGAPGVIVGLDEWVRRAEAFDWQRATRETKPFRLTGQKAARVRFIEPITVAADGVGYAMRRCVPGEVVEFPEEVARDLVQQAVAVQV